VNGLRENRQEMRLKSDSSRATLHVTTGEQIDVQIKNISKNGVGLVTASSLAVGSSVVLVRGAMRINGIVTHCSEISLEQHSIGVRIISVVNTSTGKEF